VPRGRRGDDRRVRARTEPPVGHESPPHTDTDHGRSVPSSMSR
jgi:hypothetical protein